MQICIYRHMHIFVKQAGYQGSLQMFSLETKQTTRITSRERAEKGGRGGEMNSNSGEEALYEDVALA